MDLNRNFPYKFGVNAPTNVTDSCSDTYEGASAGSEAETKGILSLASSANVKAWLHYDNFGEVYYVPWTFDGSTDYGSALLNSTYASIESQLQTNGASYGTQQGVNEVNISGSLIDYALSLGAISLQGALSSQNLQASSILDECSKHMANALIALSPISQALVLEFNSQTLTLCSEASCTTLGNLSLAYELTNPSFVPRNVSISLSLSSTSALTYEIYSIALGSQTLLWGASPVLLIAANSSVSLEILVIVSGNETNPTISAVAQAYLPEALTYSGLAYVSSGNVSNEYTNTGLFERSWYISGTHHEGVAVGLVTTVIIVPLALVILLIFCLYKNNPGNSDESDLSSLYVAKEEVHVARSEDVRVEIGGGGQSFGRNAISEAELKKAEARPPSRAEANIQKAFAKPSLENDNTKIILKPSEVDRNKFGIHDKEESSAINIPNKAFPAPPKNVEIPRDKFEGKIEKTEIRFEVPKPVAKIDQPRPVVAIPVVLASPSGSKTELSQAAEFRASDVQASEYSAPSDYPSPSVLSGASPYPVPLRSESPAVSNPPYSIKSPPGPLSAPSNYPGPPLIGGIKSVPVPIRNEGPAASEPPYAVKVPQGPFPVAYPAGKYVNDSSSESSEIHLEILTNPLDENKGKNQYPFPPRSIDNDDEFEIKRVTEAPARTPAFPSPQEKVVPPVRNNPGPPFLPSMMKPAFSDGINDESSIEIIAPGYGDWSAPPVSQKKEGDEGMRGPFMPARKSSFDSSSGDSSGHSK